MKESSEKSQTKKLDLLASCGVINKLLNLSKNSDAKIVKRAVKLIAHISINKHSKIEQYLIKSKILKRFKFIIKTYPTNTNLIKLCFIIVSNLIVGSDEEAAIK